MVSWRTKLNDNLSSSVYKFLSSPVAVLPNLKTQELKNLRTYKLTYKFLFIV